MASMRRRAGTANVLLAVICLFCLICLSPFALQAAAPPSPTGAEKTGADAGASAKADSGGCATNTLGTSIPWYPTLAEAAKVARQEGKLVFLIQVSGNFARQEFT